MSLQYTQTNFRDAIWDPLIDDNISNILTVQNVMNETVREVIGELDLRSTKRRIASSPNLFDDIYDYICPSDLKGLKIIDVIPQVSRDRNAQWNLVSQEEFDRRKAFEKYLVAFRDNDILRKLRVSAPQGTNFKSMTITSLDTLTSGGGTFVSFLDATNVRVDTVNFVEGSGSIEFDIGTGGSGLAGIANTTMTPYDLTDYISSGSMLMWAYFPTITNVSSVTLAFGPDGTNYWSQTVTTDIASNSFVVGWNLLRFDLATATKTGSPAYTANVRIIPFITSSPAITSVANWRFDMVKAEIGRFYDLLYYSKYGWQSSAGTYKENSTTSTDLVVADTEEFDLFVLKGQMKAAKRVKDWDTYKVVSAEYDKKVKAYLQMYPSDALLLTQTYHDFNKDFDIESRTRGFDDFDHI